MPRRVSVTVSAGLLLLLTALPSDALAQIAPADEQAIQQLVSRLYEARVKRDVAAAAALFAAKAPGRINPRFPANYVFPYERLEVKRFSITNLRQQAATIVARVVAEVTLTPTPVDPPRAERWVRNMAFVNESDAWLLWRDAPAAEDLAVEIVQAQSPEERDRLLGAQADLITEELAFALEGQADRLFQTAGASKAVAVYELALGIGERVKSVAAIARMHLKIGQALQVNPTAKPAAIGHFEQARDGFNALGDRPRIASAEIGLATSYYMQDDQASREHYQKAVDVLSTLPDRIALARALHSYGNACYMVGDFAAALEAYHRSMSLQEAAGTRAGIPSLWQAIGRVQKEQRDYDAAIESYEKSLADSAFDYAAQFGGTTGIADVYRLQGRFEMALEQYGRALALSRSQNDDQGGMQVEGDTGNVYMSAQQPAAALEHYQRSHAIAQQLRNASGAARALAGMGAAYFAEMQYDAALDAYGRALAIQRNKGDIAWLHAHIGLVQSAIEKHDAALESYQKALDLSRELEDRAAVAVMLTLLATEHAELDHGDQALELAEAAAQSARQIENDDTVARAKVIAARVLWKKGDRDAAERALWEGIAAVESGRVRTGDEPPEHFFGDTRSPYRAMALLLADQGKAADALLFAERAQIALLGDILTGNRSLITNGMSQEQQEEERRLAGQRKSLRVQMAKEQDRPAPDAARLASLQAGLADVEQQRNAFAEKIYAANPALKLQRGFIDAAAIEHLSAAVTDARTAVLEFVTTDKQTVVFVLTQQRAPSTGEQPQVRIDTRTIDISLIDLARQVRAYRALIRARDQGVAKAAQDLHALLLQPLADALADRTRLVIVPDGPLWALPFQALQSPDGRYLIQRCAVSYAPSLTALDLLSTSSLREATPPGGRRRVVALANRQPGSAAERLKLLNAAVNVGAMPNAEQEARRLALLYGAGRAKVYLGTAASQEAIRGDAHGAGLLHLATFFAPSAASPMRSPIVFSIGKTGQADLVEAWELMRDGVAPTVVVSRVHVDRVAGEGHVPVGLSWVFFAGGARTAVLATWPDDSPAAVSLMLGLHRNLSGAGAAPAARALRRAILPLLATRYRHPFYWANYAVIGVG